MISADESTKPDASRAVPFVPDITLSFRAIGSGVRHYLELLTK